MCECNYLTFRIEYLVHNYIFPGWITMVVALRRCSAYTKNHGHRYCNYV